VVVASDSHLEGQALILAAHQTGSTPGSVPVRSPELLWVLRPSEEASELMWHHTGQRREHDGGAIGTRYRHMTPEMQARVLPCH
jgi:hypothetical protein